MLFKMEGCQFCPQMKRIFEDLHREGALDSLQVIDVMREPEIAEKYNIRSVPSYRINQDIFSGLKTRKEIKQLLLESEQIDWRKILVEELSDGQLESAQSKIRQHSSAIEAMFDLLADKQTALVVRIGLTAVIETLTGEGKLGDYEAQFIQLSSSEDETIVTDAIYYLTLLGTDSARDRLQALTLHSQQNIAQYAREAIVELNT